MILNATYVSVWDGDTFISTDCRWDTEKRVAFDIDSVDVGGIDILICEFVLLPDGTEIEVDHELENEDGIPAVDEED